MRPRTQAARAQPHGQPSPASPASPCHLHPDLGIGVFTLAGKKVSMPHWQNQDASLIEWVSQSRLVVAVCDGHGLAGRQASHATVDFFRAEAQVFAGAGSQQFEAIFAGIFARAHAKLDALGISQCGGTTAALALIDCTAGTVSIAHVGDSRSAVMLGQSVFFETTDHGFDAAAVDRISKHGGEVREETYMSVTSRRVFERGSPGPGLAMSRSLGDAECHRLGVSAEPSVHCCMPFFPGCSLLLASDGVWDMFTTRQAACEIASLSDPSASAQRLSERARDRWVAKHEDVDDITALLVSWQPGGSNGTSGQNSPASPRAMSPGPSGHPTPRSSRPASPVCAAAIRVRSPSQASSTGSRFHLAPPRQSSPLDSPSLRMRSALANPPSSVSSPYSRPL